MQRHRSAGPDPLAPAPGTYAAIVQRAVLLELIVDPPPYGDRLSALAHALEHPLAAVAAAAADLAVVGLATRDGEVVRATVAGHRFESLALVRA
jgi:hypothetical protein